MPIRERGSDKYANFVLPLVMGILNAHQEERD
jgi:hypothetical protein